METSRSISHNNLITKCGNFCFAVLWSLLPLQLQAAMMTMTRQVNALTLKNARLLSNSILRLPLLVQIGQGVMEVIRRVRVYISTRKVNKRLIVGIFLVGLGPFADIFYTFDFLEYFIIFRKSTKLGDWYYDNCFYVFLCIGPYLMHIFNSIGLYLIYQQTDKPNSWLLVMPVAYGYAKILWLLNANNDISFHQPSPALIVLVFVVLLSALWFLSDYVAWRKYHRADSYDRRMDTISTAHKYKLIPAEKVADDFVTTWSEMKAKNY